MAGTIAQTFLASICLNRAVISIALLRYNALVAFDHRLHSAGKTSGRVPREVVQRRLGTPADWMGSLDWLREREAKIQARIQDESSQTPRTSIRPADRRARRDALAIIRRRIAELEAVNVSSTGGL
jgi:hypothetical protein